MPKAIVIGGGLAGMSCAAYLAKSGYEVSILEKNETLGGRCSQWESEGYTFDMGPSWYWMPDIFERFYQDFGKTQTDFYHLKRLDPSYRVYFENDIYYDLPASFEALLALFESIEAGSAEKIRSFLKQAEYKYNVGIFEFALKPSLSITEFFDFRILKSALKMDLLTSLKAHVAKYVKHPHIQKILEFPVLFLGSTPAETPALYSLMNYADIVGGTWYPEGGMYQISKAFQHILEILKVNIQVNTEVAQLIVKGDKVVGVETTTGELYADIIVSGADYEHTENRLMPNNSRSYSPKYWESRQMSPSSLLFYVGINTKWEALPHHTLFFDENFDAHAQQIYANPSWPEKPLFYASRTTATDSTGAPDGCENLFFLIPLAPGLEDNDEMRAKYWEIINERVLLRTGFDMNARIQLKRSFAMRDFEERYHSYKGNAYGLANTLRQTAILKPRIVSKKLKNLFYTGQLTVPGPGMPPAILSGELVAKYILKTR